MSVTFQSAGSDVLFNQKVKDNLKLLMECQSDVLPKDPVEFLLDATFNSALNDVQLTAFLTLLSEPKKLYNYQNLFGIVSYINNKITSDLRKQLDLPEIDFDNYVDIVGTGGDGLSTFNVSTSSSIVASGAGCPIAKHGNYSATSNTSSSAKFMEAIGCPINQLDKNKLRTILKNKQTQHYIYLLAPLFLPDLGNLPLIRRQLGFKTIFNIIGPLINPLKVKRFVIGVSSYELGEIFAKLMINQFDGKVKMGFIVHGDIGLDEVSCKGKTHLWKIQGKNAQKQEVTPEDFGLKEHEIKDVTTKSSAENSMIFSNILNQTGTSNDAVCDFLLMNSSLALVAGGIAKDFKEGVALSRKSIEEGQAKRVLVNFSESIRL